MIHMRQYNDFETNNVRFLVNKQVPFTTLQITETGINKSIMDATAPVRAYLKEHHIHDYEQQQQGELGKRLIDSYILTDSGQYYTKTSLYRPLTKKGDPRIWINKVRGLEFLHANDIFAIIAQRGLIYAINLTCTDIPKVYNSPIVTPLKDLISKITRAQTCVSEELLTLIKERMSDWIPTERFADTGVGRTVETLLGIRMNSETTPDYKGIELKSHREASKVRNTLFTQSPDWEISRLKSGKAIVEQYGYIPAGYCHKSLHVTLNANKPNPQGLGLTIIPQSGILEANEFSLTPTENGAFIKTQDVAAWKLIKLHERLFTKHRETFWIDAETRKENGKEYFRCTEILHTKNPIPSQFDILLDQGQISVDFLLCRRSGGDTYSFKIKSAARELLFPQSEVYNLSVI